MSRPPAARVVRWAGWCLSLLLITSAGNVAPGAAEPQAVASSVVSPPSAVLYELRKSLPYATVSSTPTPTSAPIPTPVSEPTAAPQPPPATAAPEPPPAAPPPSPKVYADADPAAAAAVYALTNKLRAENGLPALALNSALNSAAGRYAASLAENDWFAHEGPDGSTLTSRVEAAGYSGWTYLAENLYRGLSGETAEDIVQAWAERPVHYSNMLGEQITEIGVGCYISGDLRWCVQDFGDR